jgi:CHAT domain-containing protein/tetratricopeptide (TPR) repeat protein
VDLKHLFLSALILVVTLPTLGSIAIKTRPGSSVRNPSEGREIAELRELRQRGNALYRARQYLEASRIYESGYQDATGRGQAQSALRFLNNLGSAEYQIFRYREAIKAYLEARTLALSQRDQQALAAIYSNLSSLYFQMGDMDAATESAERGLELPPSAADKFRARLLTQSALIRTRHKDWKHALALLQHAIAVAHSDHDVAAEALAWCELGATWREYGQLPPAERALLEALRLYKSTGDDRIHYAWEELGELRSLQGDSKSAVRFFDQAIESAEPLGPVAVWYAYYLRGRALMAQGRTREAYRDLGDALGRLRRSRAEVLPADAFRVSTEVQLHQVYSTFIELGSQLYRQTGQRRFAEESFAVAEETRAASLRALWAGSDLTKKLPAEYWQTLSELQEAEASLLRKDTGQRGVSEPLRRARLKLSEMEVEAGLDLPYSSDPDEDGRAPSRLLKAAQAALGADEVFMSFHLGDSESCVWVIARDGFEFRPLAPQADYAAGVARFVKTVSQGLPEAGPLGRQLYTQLFGSVSVRLRDKPVWVLAPEGALFDLPFAALIERNKSGSEAPQYLIERHAIRIVPAVSALFRSPAADTQGPFVGLGDPVYNRVDDRLRHAPGPGGANSPGPPLELARLVGSAREVEMCSTIWRAHGERAILLKGPDANKENLTQAVRQNPPVLHIAAHFLFPPDDSGPGMLALALQRGNKVQLLSSSEIASMRANLGLVVLDGCSSARGAILPGAGLMGMTRAWLAAGARAVIVTRWATADRDEGELFRSFYRIYYLQPPHRRTSFGRVLHEAQLAELHAGGRHADPAYWASYFCVERN